MSSSFLQLYEIIEEGATLSLDLCMIRQQLLQFVSQHQQEGEKYQHPGNGNTLLYASVLSTQVDMVVLVLECMGDDDVNVPNEVCK